VTLPETSALLRHYSILLDLLGEDSFRARAFENAARMLESQSEPLDVLIRDHKLEQIKGIGKGVSAAILEIADRSTFADLEKAQDKVPAGVFDLLRVDGLGVKKARTLWMDAHVTTLAALETALTNGIVAKLPGFGAKTAEKYLRSIEFLKTASDRHWLHHAHRAAAAVQESLSGISGITEIFFGGSFRRNCETIGDLEVLVIAPAAQTESVRRAILQAPGFAWTETGDLFKGTTSARFPVELSVIPEQNSALRKLLVTGSKEHIRALREIAAQRNIEFDSIVAASEQDIYSALGLESVPPALREGKDNIFPAGAHPFPQPIALTDIRGILHCHSTYSDGHNTLRDLAAAMIGKGYQFLGIADHSQAAAYARGLTPDRVRAQWKEIDELNRELAPFRLLKGTEVDILADGRPDFEDELLAGFDFVIASIHSGFAMTEDQATERLCRAIENPHVDILGHLTGRLLLERAGYPVHHERVIECAARNGKSIELNCNPHRLDLDWRWLCAAQEAGVVIPLSPDAHVIEGLWDIRYGVNVAAKGPLTAANCPNTWTTEAFLQWCNTHKRAT
jgi:DNA polymerase (family 10)